MAGQAVEIQRVAAGRTEGFLAGKESTARGGRKREKARPGAGRIDFAQNVPMEADGFWKKLRLAADGIWGFVGMGPDEHYQKRAVFEAKRAFFRVKWSQICMATGGFPKWEGVAVGRLRELRGRRFMGGEGNAVVDQRAKRNPGLGDRIVR